MMTITPVADIGSIDHREAIAIAATENERVIALLRALRDDEWTRPTDCDLWDVRAMAGHLLGAMEGFSSLPSFVRLMMASRRAKGTGTFVDGMTSWQVRTNADLSVSELLDRLSAAAGANVRGRDKKLRVLRRVPIKQDNGEVWKGSYLLDIILTRDMWMHRVDITRATGRTMELTAEHDGRIVEDVVAEWARRHGQSFTLRLEGSAGGTFVQGTGGDEITIDAVEFCRIVSGRAEGTGLLATEVPF